MIVGHAWKPLSIISKDLSQQDKRRRGGRVAAVSKALSILQLLSAATLDYSSRPAVREYANCLIRRRSEKER